ncbi:hypothetical protein NE237_024535 [Protea cynaroides]|uniref:F-box protein At3g26010-like beta-propeller domain-containing protein n=1 Tax=Protea cynaroides TaxID=273540 RepID=A0A9Q0JYN0_9MAGN|nr:hypothetical protein NE237_024535 [Protea cynaroides]
MEQPIVQKTVLDFLPEKVVLECSSNGLLCCRSCFPAQDPMIYVCNPSIKEWVKLNWPKKPDKNDRFTLTFNPLSHPVDICKDVKVVSIHQEVETETNAYSSIEIYSSEIGARKTLEERRVMSAVLIRWRTMEFLLQGHCFSNVLQQIKISPQDVMIDVLGKVEYTITILYYFYWYDGLRIEG